MLPKFNPYKNQINLQNHIRDLLQTAPAQKRTPPQQPPFPSSAQPAKTTLRKQYSFAREQPIPQSLSFTDDSPQLIQLVKIKQFRRPRPDKLLDTYDFRLMFSSVIEKNRNKFVLNVINSSLQQQKNKSEISQNLLNQVFFPSQRSERKSILLQPYQLLESKENKFIQHQSYVFQLIYGQKIGSQFQKYCAFMKYENTGNEELEMNVYDQQPGQVILNLINDVLIKIKLK